MATRKKVAVAAVRHEAPLSDEELVQALAVPREHHVLRGVRELVYRLEDETRDEFADIRQPVQVRADAGVMLHALRLVRMQIEDWNTKGQQGTGSG